MVDNDYISRKAAQDEACDRCNQQGHCNHPELCPVMISIENIPAADVRPAVHGQWIYDCERTMGDGWTYKQRHCSECGYQTVECDNFCQHCGAIMDA